MECEGGKGERDEEGWNVRGGEGYSTLCNSSVTFQSPSILFLG